MWFAHLLRRVRDMVLKRTSKATSGTTLGTTPGTTPGTTSKVMEASVGFQSSLGIKKFTPGHQGPVIDHVQRTKRGGKSGQPAHEDLRFDRSDPTKTVKTHHVEEQAPDGTWHTVHDEQVDYPAKRRRPRSSDS